MVRASGAFVVLVMALAVLASAEARRELLQGSTSPSSSPSTSPAASTSPASPAGSTSPPASPKAAAAAVTATSPAAATQAASSPQPAATAQSPAAGAQSPATAAQSPAAATTPATGPTAAQTPGSAPAPGQPGNTVINNNNNNNNNNQQTSINPTFVSNTNNNNNNNNNPQPAILQQGATFQPGPGASASGPVVGGGALVAGPAGGGVSSGGSQGGSSGGSSGGSPGPNNCPATKDGLTVTEQFLAQICAAQSARYNGQYIASSLLQNSGGKTDNALICCAACLDSSTCTAWNFQASGQAAYDGTPSGTCQLVSGTKGASDTLASGSGQPFIGGFLAKTSP